MFERDGGVAEPIRVRRLAGAAIELGSPAGQRRRISEVKRRWGFTDDSSFSRAFRGYTGIAPSEARSRSAGIWTREHGGHASRVEGPKLAYWLRF